MEPALATGIILSDNVIREAGTNKLSLIGCFINWNANRFPFVAPPFFATALVTNLRGKFSELNITVRIETPTAGHVLTSVSGKLQTREPRVYTQDEILEIPLPIPAFTIPQAGTYHVIVLVDNEPVGKRPFTVRAATTSGMSGIPEAER